MSIKARIWDLPTRLFHWALVAVVIGLFVTGYIGGGWMAWHARFGYAMLVLLVFRIVWGFVGGRWSRFSSFICHPGAMLAYLRGRAHPDHLIGHSPVGALSVFLMLSVLLAQVATGLVGDDEISFTGPLNRFVQSSLGLAATWYHKRVGQWLVLALIALHIGAVLFHQLGRRNDLIGPMLGGDKIVSRPVTASRDDVASRLAALCIVTICTGAVWLLVRSVS